MAKITSIINFKGGVGKTSLALHLACYIERHADNKSNKVLLIDIDQQSSLSIICLDPKRWEETCEIKSTINRIFSAYTTSVPMPGSEIISKNPFGRNYPNLDLLSSQPELDDTEIDLATTTIGNPLQSEWTKRTLLCNWLEKSGANDKYDFIIIDCPPASKIVCQNAIAASHYYVVPVIPDTTSTRGVTHFCNFVKNQIDAKLKSYSGVIPSDLIPNTYIPDTRLNRIVISHVHPHGPADSGYIDEHTRNMKILRRDWGNKVCTNFIEHATGVAESIGEGWPVYNNSEYPNVYNRNLPGMFFKVCKEIFLKMA